MMFSVFLILLVLSISYFTVSVLLRHMVEEQQPVKVTKRQTNSDSADGLIKVNGFVCELSNASLPNFLKDLFIKFSLPTHPLKDQKIVTANTNTILQEPSRQYVAIYHTQFCYYLVKSLAVLAHCT